MGRNKKYITKNDKYDAECKWKREWYQRNAVSVRKKRMDRYWEQKKMEKELSDLQ